MSSNSKYWKVVGSSVIGTSHVRHGMPCQDAHATLILPDATLLLVVADGAGSAGRSDHGSRIAVKSSLQFLECGLSRQIPRNDEAWELLLRDTLRDARLALENNIGVAELRDLATTLLLVIARQDTLATAQIGDGAIVYRDAAGMLRALTPISQNEFINETSFLTTQAFQEQAICTVLSSVHVDAVAVFSDGVQPLAIQYPMNIPHPGFFNPLFEFAGREDVDPRELEGFLSSVQVNERTDDDKSLVLAVRNVAA